MSFHDVAITVTAENRASPAFAEVSADASRMNVNLSRLATSISTVGMMSSYFLMLANDIGIADKESSKHVRTLIHVITVTSSIIRLKYYLMTVTKASTAAVATNTAVQSANTGASISNSLAKLAYIVKTKIATAVTWAFNASLAAKITLLTLGVGAVVVAAAAMAALAMQTRAAASAVRDYNAAAVETPSYTRSIRRAGEEDLRRRGIE